MRSIITFRGWSRDLIWASVELCQVEGQPKAPPWSATRGNIIKIVDNSGQLAPTFFFKHWWNINRLEYSDSSFVLFTVLICSDSVFNLLKRVTENSFLFLCKKLFFLFLPFLNLAAQIRCPQNRYTDLKSAQDQSVTFKTHFA